MKNFKVSIQNIKNPEREWAGYFDTEEDAQSWLSAQKSKEGRLDQREVQASADTVEEDVVEDRSAEIEGKVVRHVTLCAQATYLISNVSRQAKLSEIKAKQKQLLDEADIMLNKAQDGEGGPSVGSIRAYRSAIRAVNNFFQDNEEDLEALVVADYVWPVKP